MLFRRHSINNMKLQERKNMKLYESVFNNFIFFMSLSVMLEIEFDLVENCHFNLFLIAFLYSKRFNFSPLLLILRKCR